MFFLNRLGCGFPLVYAVAQAASRFNAPAPRPRPPTSPSASAPMPTAKPSRNPPVITSSGRAPNPSALLSGRNLSEQRPPALRRYRHPELQRLAHKKTRPLWGRVGSLLHHFPSIGNPHDLLDCIICPRRFPDGLIQIRRSRGCRARTPGRCGRRTRAPHAPGLGGGRCRRVPKERAPPSAKAKEIAAWPMRPFQWVRQSVTYAVACHGNFLSNKSCHAPINFA